VIRDAGRPPHEAGQSLAAAGTPAHRGPPALKVQLVGDHSRYFTLALAASWMLIVAVPLIVSVWQDSSWHGIPLLGVAIWFALQRAARWILPAAHCDRLLRRGEYAQAQAVCERALGVTGSNAWHGNRRIAWLNHRTTALLGAGCLSQALVAALEAVDARPDPETLANCAECLLWLNRYQEAAEAARAALALTRERSVSGLAVLAHTLLAEGRPAEAQALAQAGMADVEALLPFVRPTHHVALLTALCRAERTLDDFAQAHKHLAMLRRAARRNPLLQAQALLEAADGLATGDDAERGQAYALLEQAIQLAPHYVCWFLTQPLTLHELRGDPHFAQLAQRAREDWVRAANSPLPPEQGAPPPTFVAVELAAVRERGYVRPAPAASWRALVAQALTLGGTLALMVWWTWRFFLLGN
jgi:tetratricopeptide (TPR) repeat protein